MISTRLLTPEQKNEILGQAYFYRSWFYFQIIKRYGGMPIIDKVFEGGDDDIPRVTYHESHDWMMEDIQKQSICYLIVGMIQTMEDPQKLQQWHLKNGHSCLMQVH